MDRSARGPAAGVKQMEKDDVRRHEPDRSGHGGEQRRRRPQMRLTDIIPRLREPLLRVPALPEPYADGPDHVSPALPRRQRQPYADDPETSWEQPWEQPWALPCEQLSRQLSLARPFYRRPSLARRPWQRPSSGDRVHVSLARRRPFYQQPSCQLLSWMRPSLARQPWQRPSSAGPVPVSLARRQPFYQLLSCQRLSWAQPSLVPRPSCRQPSCQLPSWQSCDRPRASPMAARPAVRWLSLQCSPVLLLVVASFVVGRWSQRLAGAAGNTDFSSQRSGSRRGSVDAYPTKVRSRRCQT